MPLEPGTTLGPYEIEAAAGVGGMGEVYRARDTRLDRTVALKVLPEHRAGDADARARLEREAKSISSLQHPNICALFDIGHEEGIDYLVMEYLEGDTLAERLAAGRMPASDALRIAVQIADGLAAAHRQGFVHRDLKPGNVMLTKSGAKLLDFGLAKALDTGPTPELTSAPTAATPLTAAGTIMGTYQYMAPEQLEGTEADARSDLFAFGALLYEMFTGKRAFEGKSQASLVASILKEEPRPVSVVEPASPPAVDRFLQRCLAKDPDDRWQSASDLGHELRAIAEGTSVVGMPVVSGAVPVAAAPASPRVPWAVAAVLAVIAAVLGFLAFRGPEAVPDAAPVAFQITAPEGQLFRPAGDFAAPPVVSPDGRHIVFGTLEPDGRSRLWLRFLETTEVTPLQDSDGGHRPFWSADSRSVAFFTVDELKVVPIAGGPALPLCDVDDARGGTWNADGIIVFARGASGPLMRVSAEGGTPEPVTELDTDLGQASHRYPHFLPDGKTVIYLAIGGAGAAGTGAEAENEVWAVSLDGGDTQRILKGAASAQYANGELLFFRGGALMGQPFDPDTLALSGEVRVVLPEVEYDAAFERGIFSVSPRLLAYRSGGYDGTSIVKRFRADGMEDGPLGPPAAQSDPAISPGGDRLALTVVEEANTDVWIHDMRSGLRTRLTFDASQDGFPRWSPDGGRVAYATSSVDGWQLAVQSASGEEGSEKILFGSAEEWAFPVDWTRDGRRIVFADFRELSSPRVAVIDAEQGSQPEWVLEGMDQEMRNVRLSPDNRWLSYASDNSGRWEVYITSFPSGEGRWQVSTGGGVEPVWSPDGTALYYRAGGGMITRALLDVSGGVPRVSAIEPLFEVSANVLSDGATYDVGADGSVIVSTVSERDVNVPITVVLDWK